VDLAQPLQLGRPLDGPELSEDRGGVAERRLRQVAVEREKGVRGEE
jgi:hypothetical protein